VVIVSQIPIATSKAYSPGHVTGFYSIPEYAQDSEDSKLLGSLGAGFSIDRGITSKVRVFSSAEKKYEIKLNGFSNYDLKVSKYVTEYYLNTIRKPVFLSIDHFSDLPIGFGLGSSGSAALSLSYALNEALGTHFSEIQAAQVAHEADIRCNTGRGTVISEFVGGLEIRIGVGGPGVGRVIKTDLSKDWYAVILCIEPIETAFYLGDRFSQLKRKSMNLIGAQMTKFLEKNNTVKNFLELSHDFASKFELTNGRCCKSLNQLKSEGVISSVALFGHTLFTLVNSDSLKTVCDILKNHQGQLMVCRIDNVGARILENSA
jgi:pantoate kinase